MAIDRRTALTQDVVVRGCRGLAGLGAAQGDPQAGQGSKPAERRTRVRKIATGEAFTIPEMIEPVRDVLHRADRAWTSRYLAQFMADLLA